MTRRGSGFTLLEVSVALLLASLVALLVVRQVAGSSRLERSAAIAADGVAAVDLGADLLMRELRRAGFVPYPAPATPTLDRSAPTLQLTVRASAQHGDAVGVRYVDASLADGPVLRDLRFEAGRDGRGDAQLYRSTASGNRQPMVQGVTALRLEGWVDAEGLHRRDALAPGRLEPWSLLLSVGGAGDRRRTLTATLPSRPLAEVVVVP